MASKQSTVDYIAEQISKAGNITQRKMFGEYALYCDDKLVALICDDQLFLKPTAAGRAFAGKVKEKPPYKGAKPYFWIAGDHWDDRDWLTKLLEVSAAELPMPVKKPRKKKLS